ncbi:MAG: hypothetical protein HGA45_35135 [Chloroflexales bacterium]|nr:hypothetical protein [Chloroflexales bacterium]
MFSRRSRYYRLPDTVDIDAAGRTLPAKSLRLAPRVAGRHRHIVTEGERLDHLAERYYRQPTRWWRICDANPEPMWPLALLGQDPVVTCRLGLTFPGPGAPPWAELLRAVRATVGVEAAELHDDDDGLIVRLNSMNLAPADLAAIAEGLGFTAAPPRLANPVGQPIIIPPDTAI